MAKDHRARDSAGHLLHPKKRGRKASTSAPKKHRKSKAKHVPSPKARKAYIANMRKSFKRLAHTIYKHEPQFVNSVYNSL
jgi:hypothetical protein